ncbi:hypothetical protein EG328_000458 [Venturia inaequalis]|uniref:Microtubule associated protein n=1 Tax=Venturia inaequalis TaxID=5025 RepID=A0A8H3Z1U1_VENIN|nr:hypothetical protein EG328_000458 [Venturia inaequalis]
MTRYSLEDRLRHGRVTTKLRLHDCPDLVTNAHMRRHEKFSQGRSLDRPPKNSLNAAARRIYNPIGFSRFYNFILWIIFAGALFGFLLARAAYMNFNGVFCGGDLKYGAAPGECLSYKGHYKFGIIMHLVTIFPAGFLVLFQFIPAIRHHIILFHRINGYAIVLLVLFSNAGALMAARVAFGGTLSTQMWVGFVAIITTLSLVLAWINIKRLQIDQHRIWMLRAWFYLASVITERLIALAAQPIIKSIGSYVYAMRCSKIVGIMTTYGIPAQAARGFYPACIPFLNGQGDPYAVVQAGGLGRPEQIAAALSVSFGACLWLALMINAIGIEIYISLTPREHERLRQVSYERQQEAGMSHAGSSGLTADRFGDSEPWRSIQKYSVKGRENSVEEEQDK